MDRDDMIYSLARKAVLGEHLTEAEKEQREEIFADRSSYTQYCSMAALMDMVERRGPYTPKYRYETVEKTETVKKVQTRTTQKK